MTALRRCTRMTAEVVVLFLLFESRIKLFYSKIRKPFGNDGKGVLGRVPEFSPTCISIRRPPRVSASEVMLLIFRAVFADNLPLSCQLETELLESTLKAWGRGIRSSELHTSKPKRNIKFHRRVKTVMLVNYETVFARRYRFVSKYRIGTSTNGTW